MSHGWGGAAGRRSRGGEKDGKEGEVGDGEEGGEVRGGGEQGGGKGRGIWGEERQGWKERPGERAVKGGRGRLGIARG